MRQHRFTGADGYVMVKVPDHPYANHLGYVREHRLVVEKRLGRYLEPHEVVHHVNGDRPDNRPENLDLLPDQAAHAALHTDRETALEMQRRSTATKRRRVRERMAKPRYCGCGCGGRIPLDPKLHKPSTMPRFLHGHGHRVHHDRRFQEWLAKHGEVFCQCGCGQRVELTRQHYKNRRENPPRYAVGHNRRKR